jgi:MFS family permease
MGPVVWTVINEIFPGYIRGRAVAVATAVNWAATFVVSQTFVTLIGTIGNTLTFWLFALFCGISWIWIFYRVPETKGNRWSRSSRSGNRRAPDADCGRYWWHHNPVGTGLARGRPSQVRC